MRKLIIYTAILFLSCEEIIDIDLNTSEPELVIEAYIDNTGGPATATISQTTNFFEDTQTDPVSANRVTIYTSDNTAIPLSQTAAGQFASDNIIAADSELYSIQIEMNEGTVLTAQSYMPQEVDITGLIYEFNDSEFGPAGEAGYELTCTFYDPPGDENYYRLLVYQNGELIDDNDLYLYEDRFSDGNFITYTFFDKRFQQNDVVEVKLWSINEESFDYYTQLNDILAGGQGPNQGSAAPGNPYSLFEPEALGLFIAYAQNSTPAIITIE